MQVLSSLSSIPFYAPSAGHAPTNSADVSAIASAYQVVSSTATQLYAGTAYLTSVNDNQISASRAGNAANASLANSAYYDGTGRLISALPDSAAVSAIASSYAAPKLDTSALDKWQTGEEPLLAYSGINGIPIHPTAADYANESDYAESAGSATYAESADYWIDASSKQDALTFGYDAEDKISGINGSAIAGGEGGGTTYVSPSGTVWISGSSIEGTDSAYVPESAQQNYTADDISVGPTLKWINEPCTSLKVSGGYWNAPISVFDSFDTLVTSLPVDVGALYTVSGGTPPYKVSSEEWSTMDYSAYGDPTIIPAKLIKLAHASASSNYYTTANVSGFFNSASVGFNADNQISSIGGSALAGGGIKVSPSGTLWISGESAESTDSAFIPGVASETFVQSGGSFQIGTTQPLTVAGANKVTIQSANWFDGTIYVSGNGTLVSSVAHTATDWPQTFSAEAPISIGANGWFDVGNYSAFNVVTSPDQVVQLAHASAVSGYALSADVSGTVDLVSTQSANWGGSALALSAGPGVKLEKVGDTLVASTDETVLWSASGYEVGDSSQSIILSESPLNFNTIRIYGYRPLNTSSPCGVFSDDIDIQWLNAASVNQIACPYTIRATTTQYVGSFELSGITSTTWVEGGWHCGLANTASVATNGIYAHLHKVVGINRTAEA